MLGINIRNESHGSSNTARCLSQDLFDSNVYFYDNFTFDSNLRDSDKQDPLKLNFSVRKTLAIDSKYFDHLIFMQGITSGLEGKYHEHGIITFQEFYKKTSKVYFQIWNKVVFYTWLYDCNVT